MPTVPIPVHSYALDARSASSARLVNMYAEQAPEPDKPVILRTAPGIAAYVTLFGGGRGIHWVGNECFAVAGAKFYRIVAGTATEIGDVLGSDRCWITNNGLAVVVVCAAGGYVWNGSTFTQITDPDFVTRNPGAADFLDGYLVFVERNSGRFFCSDLNAAATYDALDFATAEAGPDHLVTLKVDHRQLVLVGTQTTELWYNSGASSGFPFERVPGGVIEIGGLAEHGITKLDNSVIWLASDRTARRLNGATPQRVSTHGVEESWRGYARVDDCQAYSYTQGGHVCAVFRFPSAGAAWVYDATAGEWHERESYLGEPWRVCASAEGLGVTYVQDATTGSVGTLEARTFTEWGDTLRAEWTYQGLRGSGQRLYHADLEMGIETGVGLATGQGSDPLLSLGVSNDGGRTFETIPMRSIGRQGDYRRRVVWHRLGSAAHRVYRASFSDPVPLTVWDTQLRLA